MPPLQEYAALLNESAGQPGWRVVKTYLGKMKGGSAERGQLCWKDALWSWVGAFVGMAGVGWLSHEWLSTQALLMIGSFGATSVLLYSTPDSPLAQPRNVLGGNVLSALVGVLCWLWLGDDWAGCRGRGLQFDSGDAVDPHPAPPRRRNGLDRGHWLTGAARVGVGIRAGTGGGGVPAAVGDRYPDQQSGPASSIPTPLVVRDDA